MQIRLMCSADLDRLVVIDAAASSFPWSRGKFIESYSADAPCYVLEIRGQLAAFAIYNQVLDEASLLNIAVVPGYQGRGCGRALLVQSLELVQEKSKCCFLEVRASNQAAIKLYASVGFERIGLRRGYYPAERGREDALVMRLSFLPE